MGIHQTKVSIRDVGYTFNAGSKERAEVCALNGISLEIKENEIVSLLGPSGCGKTTLLRIMAGLLRPTLGQVLVDGKNIEGPGRDRAVVFQEDAVFPWLTVEQNIGYGLSLAKVPNQKKQGLVEDYIELVGLKGFERSFPRELSGGMRKRVDIARCYINEPVILLMDEPFGALDAMTKSKMHEDLLNLWLTKQSTICFVTHDIEEAIFLSHRVVILTARPGTIKTIMDIPFGNDRKQELKMTAEFQEIRRELWGNIGEETF